MRRDRWIGAVLGGLVLTLGLAGPAPAQALRVMEGAAVADLKVPVSRAVVVESETPFAELSIANPDIADISSLSDRTIYVLGKTPGRTTLTLLGPEGRLISNVGVLVTPDITEFKERLGQILPDEPIDVRTANDGIVLSGTVSSLENLDRALDLARLYAADRVSNLMSVGGTQQVMLKVRFSEMQRSVSKRLSGGLGISAIGGDARGTIALGSARPRSGSVAGNPGSFNLDPEARGSFSLGFDMGDVALELLLEALETKGLVRTLSEPNLTALSGQEATFLAGGEYPVPVIDEEGGVFVEYKPFGVQLTFTPTVVDRERINLQINAAVSGIDTTETFQTNGFSISSFRRRETSTTVEMRDGESFAIAGLLEDDFRDLVGQVPWLGDVPVLGALFRSADYERQQSELVIIVTPHLVNPVRGEVLALPTDRIRPPTENELFLRGATGAASGGVGEVARQDFSGSYGYVME